MIINKTHCFAYMALWTAHKPKAMRLKEKKRIKNPGPVDAIMIRNNHDKKHHDSSCRFVFSASSQRLTLSKIAHLPDEGSTDVVHRPNLPSESPATTSNPNGAKTEHNAVIPA